MRTHFFGEDIFFAHNELDVFFAHKGRRHNPNIEMPTDDEASLPANERNEPPPDAPPYHRGRPEDEPDPPIREPDRE